MLKVMQLFSLGAVVVLFADSPAMAQAEAGGPSMLMNFVPFVAMIGVMYFLMIRPQMKKQKEHQNLLSALKRGDEVLTAGGILGRIEGITDKFVTLEISAGVRIKMLRSQVVSLFKNEAST